MGPDDFLAWLQSGALGGLLGAPTVGGGAGAPAIGETLDNGATAGMGGGTPSLFGPSQNQANTMGLLGDMNALPMFTQGQGINWSAPDTSVLGQQFPGAPPGLLSVLQGRLKNADWPMVMRGLSMLNKPQPQAVQHAPRPPAGPQGPSVAEIFLRGMDQNNPNYAATLAKMKALGLIR
jgi:hypothetical protein